MNDMHESHARWLVRAAGSGRLTRREMMVRTAALGAALAAGPGALGRARAAAPQPGGHLRLAMGHGAITDTLDPAKIENGLQWLVTYAIANTLTEIGPDGVLKPSLASEWEASADAATWTFRLRDDVVFHNGKTLTAEDIVASVNYHRGEDSTSVGKPIMAPVTDVRADGPATVVFTLEGGNADFPYAFDSATFAIYPAGDDGKPDWSAGGSGGYRLVAEEPGVRYALERNPDYWKEGRAHFETIEALSITDTAARSNALVSGDVDVIDGVDLKTLALLEKRPGIVVEEGTGPLHYDFSCHVELAPFDDVNIRRAIKYGIDREDMLQKILRGHGSIGNDHPIGPSYRFHAGDIEQHAFDPDKAKYHLKQAGFDSLDIDLHAADAAFAGAVDAAQLYQASAEKAGININVVREPNDGYWSNVWGVKPFFAGYWGGYTTADEMFSTGYAPGAAWNATHWQDERFTELLVAARAELDDAKRTDMYREMQVILRDDGGAVIPMFANAMIARNESVAHDDEVSWLRSLDGRRICERWWKA